MAKATEDFLAVLNARSQDIFRKLVERYLDTGVPVGSRDLSRLLESSLSPASVRNVMADLEDLGLIAAPHTSAGRVPTDAGYRLFVDKLAAIKPMSQAERRAIGQFLDGAVDLDDVVDRTVRLLSTLTRQVAIVQYPSLTRSSVRHIELVPVAADRVLVVLITTTGRVDLLGPAGEGLLARVRAEVGAVATGALLADAARGLSALPARLADGDEARLTGVVAAALADALVEEREERVVIAGTSHLARHGGEFTTSLGPVLEALEEHVVLLKLLGTASEQGSLAVHIGHENPHAGLHSTSMVAAGYGSGSDLVAGLGVVGPTRMDYPTTMAAVRAVATYVSRILDR